MPKFKFEYSTQAYFGLKLSAVWESPRLVINHGDFVFTENELIFTPDDIAIDAFVEVMKTLTHWKKNYEEIMVDDGCNWSVKFKQGKYHINSEGYHCWPEDFARLEEAITLLTGGQYKGPF